MRRIRRLVSRSLNRMGVHDYCMTWQELWFRLLRRAGLGRDTRFFLTKDVSFLIKKETEHVFRHFTRDGGLLEDMKIFLELAQSRSTLLDIGALYGVYSLAFCSLPGKRNAYALEPSPLAFKTLQYHREINGRSFDIFNAGLGKITGNLRMKYEWVQLEIVDENARSDFEAPITTLDKFVEDEGIKPDIIKLDTEGSEYDILLGAREYLQAHFPVVLLEVHVRWLRSLGYDQADLYTLIKDIGYRVFDMSGRSLNDPPNYAYPSDPYTVLLAKQ